MTIRSKTSLNLALLLAISACHHDPPVAKDYPQVRHLPNPPTAVEIPVDDDLRTRARQELLNDAQSSDAFLRANAIEALSNVAPNDAHRAILKGLSDPEPLVRFDALLAAGQLRLDGAYAAVASMLDDPDPRVQMAVRFALHKFGNTSHSHDFETFATDVKPAIRAVAAQLLGLLGEQSAIKILKVLQADPVANVRLQATESIWRLGGADAVDALATYSLSKFADEQMIALAALAAPKDQRAKPYIRAQLTNELPEVALAAARAMGELGSDEGYSVVVKEAKSNDTGRRSLAALAMGAIGRTDLQPFLADLLQDSNPAVRLSAASAILRLKSPG